jgi:hypothetical protein
MPGPLLTTAATVMCTHGGQATLATANQKAKAGAAILLESDVHVVAGCPLTFPSGNPNPCVRIEWSAGASSVKVGGTRALVQSSVGKCLNAAGAPQGLAIVTPGQARARGR